jgi:cephalosporin hydroxylase
MDEVVEAEVVESFWRLYGEKRVWMETDWLGIRVLKSPLDLWMYQEIVFRTRPDLIVETGTFAGGGALFLASICELIGRGRILTIDVKEHDDEEYLLVAGGKARPVHPLITYLTGSSVDPEILAEVRSMIRDEDSVMVILDSDHSKDHVLAELRAYGPLVSEDCYLIVEDTSVARIVPDFGEGPDKAIEEFLSEDASFEVDQGCEKFLMTFNPGGYLRRRASGTR